MKKLRQFCVCFVLTVTLALSASAGDIPFPGATSAPSPQRYSVTGDLSSSDLACTDLTLSSDVVVMDPITEFTLSLLEGVLSFF